MLDHEHRDHDACDQATETRARRSHSVGATVPRGIGSNSGVATDRAYEMLASGAVLRRSGRDRGRLLLDRGLLGCSVTHGC